MLNYVLPQEILTFLCLYWLPVNGCSIALTNVKGRAEEFYSDDSFRLSKKVMLSFERSNFCVRTTNVPMQDLRKCHMCRLNEHEML